VKNVSGFSRYWVAGCIVAASIVHAGISSADETPVIRGETTFATPAAYARSAAALRTVVLPEVKITGSRVQPLPVSKLCPDLPGRGIVSYPIDDKGRPLPAVRLCNR
jgi:hypothetical protein